MLSEKPHYTVVPYRSEERTKGEMRRVAQQKRKRKTDVSYRDIVAYVAGLFLPLTSGSVINPRGRRPSLC